ncbi:MAG: Unknown protein [uncultured Sulfurovum sp.]|uniref:Pentapeptide repeat family protein n=1 Tax=uncultured Sulfurovum sp. TaxID=269237 RepID=A0A6S6T4K8_9BACT|nr:MAG: Unknown protein [uncultured Sulfurovum sp.]
MALWYDKKAYALLKKCSENQDLTEWNTYREETKQAPVNLRFANLRDFYLRDADLREVDLRGADLRRAKCHGADVAHANISVSFYWLIFFGAIIVSALFMFTLYTAGIEKDILEDTTAFVTFVAAFVVGVGVVGVGVGVVGVGVVGVGVGVVSVDAGIRVVDVGGGITVATVLIFVVVAIKNVIDKIQSFNSEFIAYAKNPEEAIGFPIIYLKGIAVPLSAHLDQEITVVKELLKKEQDDKEKQELQNKLEKLEDEKETKLIAEAHAATQQRKIQNALIHILKPYAYIERNISKLRRHNYFFYGVIMMLLSTFIYALLTHYLDARSSQFLSVLDKEVVSFGSIFGVILFYATPVLFGMSIIVYAISQINKNIQNMESMQAQRRSIEVLQSTLLAQTEITDVSDDEIKALTQALQKGALERMFGKDKPVENVPKETNSYREKLMVNNLSKVLTQALKSPK